jgi:ADP-ribosylglycohydrolase
MTVLTFLVSLSLLLSLTIEAQVSQTRVITRNELKDKISGYWIGQLTGNYFGFPFELLYNEEPVPIDVDTFYTAKNKGDLIIADGDRRGNMDVMIKYLEGAPSDDDHDLEFLTLHAVERFGLDITYEEIAPMIAKHVKRMVWVSTKKAANDIRNGAMPPYTGSKENNPQFWNDLMASISTEIWASFYPGMTQKAADGAEWFGRISNDDYAIYLARFYAAMYSAAFFESDYDKLLQIGLKQVPEDNILYQGIHDVQKWCAENPEWRNTRKLIYDKYFEKSTVDALPNGLMGVMSMIYSDSDYKKNLSIATSAGIDCDNQPATTGGLIGVMYGEKKLPESYTMIHAKSSWTRPYNDTYVNNTRDGLPTRTKISDIVDRICDIAEKAILENGGQKRINENGETVYIIKTDF